ncbi:protein sar deficient 1 [Quercus suber]|uniref:Protein sar deficient 1 n=1 Tax=Quercus suber TaxID=58331 RepID=A0AAW0L9E7_QUESU
MLDDDVWRLEKIGKDGAFHTKLKSEGITTVQDFLKLSVVNPQSLRRILGVGMSEKMWEVTIKHARTCVLGNKQYILRGNNHFVMFNPVCQVLKAVIDGQDYTSRELNNIDRTYIERFVRQAYENWSSLEEQHGYIVDRAIDMGYELNSDQAGCSDWTY